MARLKKQNQTNISKQRIQTLVSKKHLYNRRSCLNLGLKHPIHIRKQLRRRTNKRHVPINCIKDTIRVCFYRISN